MILWSILAFLFGLFIGVVVTCWMEGYKGGNDS